MGERKTGGKRTEKMNYFLDTYALIEIIEGNVRYKKFISEKTYTSIFNLYELYYSLLRDYDEVVAKKNFDQFKNIVIPIKEDNIFAASKFKLSYKKQRISYTDALGYSIAIQNNLVFLTGDKEFENMENVEFIK